MIYVCADIHGNKAAFHDIIRQIDFKESDELYILGDVIDRCEYGIEILKWVMDHSNVHMLLGNHEYMMLDALGYPREKILFKTQRGYGTITAERSLTEIIKSCLRMNSAG